MKFITSILITTLLSFFACLYFPWWSIAIAAFIVAALIPQKPFLNFIAAFLSITLLWCGLAFFISNNNHHILAHKVSLMILKIDNPYLLILITGIVGGLVAGFAATSAGFLRKKKVVSKQYPS